MPGRCDRGSFICEAGHELRITVRCLHEDLDEEPPQPFDAVNGHQIVVAFSSKRDVIPTGGKTVGPENAERTLFHLGRGNDHRGATWFDPQVNVVWLCAYGFHRSRTPNDAFQYFRGLIESGRIWPDAEDYLWLERDRAERLAERLPEDAQRLLAEAREAPNTEVRAIIGTGKIGVLVEVVETLEETYVAFSTRTLSDYTYLIALLVAFYPDRDYADWEIREQLPTRLLEPGEICMSILRE